MTDAQRVGHRCRLVVLHPNDLDVGPHLFDVSSDPGNQPTPADCHENRVDWLAVLPQDLHADRALPRNDIRIIERVHKRQSALLLQLERMMEGFVVTLAVEHHFGTPLAHRVDLHRRCGRRHHDDRVAPQSIGSQRHALSMVARRARDDAAVTILQVQVRHLVVRTADLE